MLLRDLSEEFIFNCQCRKLSEKTIHNYQLQVGYLLDYLSVEHGITELEKVKPPLIKQYMMSMQKRGRKPQYIGEVQTVNKPTNLPVSLSPWFNRGFSLWETPKAKQRYYIGVDSGEGLGQDYSAFQVVTEDGRQVAEFKSNKIKPFQFAELVNDVGLYFNKALLVVEKASAGHTVVDKLKNDYKYANMYKYKEYDARGNAKKKVGFVTNSKTKPLMINNFVELFETNQICINSKDLLSEMKLFAFKDGKMEATFGNHDDLVMSMAMALEGIKSGIHYI